MISWKLPCTTPEEINLLKEQTGLSETVCSVLASRGCTTGSDITNFIEQDSTLHDPYLMKDMDKAVERIRKAVANGETIVVYGDYDCDGITSTALLCSYFEDIGANAAYYIPSREKEGYGLNARSVTALHKKGVDLIITVDNGISAIDEAILAKNLGIDLIITDHHTPREILPDAVAVVNPHRADCPYPFKYLSGVGVAFKLICALEDDIHCADTLYHYGHLVAIGTVADVVELTGENRTIVKNGIPSIEEADSPGLNALIEVCGLAGKPLSSTSIAFGIAPRINAAGRVGETNKAVELLLSTYDDEAQALASEINGYNVSRKETEAEILEDIAHKIAENPDTVLQRVIVLAGEGWHHGIIGIIASRLVERYGKPCLLMSIDGEEVRGSARSVEGYSFIDAITRCSSKLTRFGGHTMAAGLSLRTSDLDEFKGEFLADTKSRFPLMPAYSISIDALLTTKELTVENVKQTEMLEPFGEGNKQPMYAVMDTVLDGITPLSGGKHLRLALSKEGARFSALYFGMTPESFMFTSGDKVDIAVNLSINEYNGNQSVTIKICDIHLSGADLRLFADEKQLYEQYILGESVPGNVSIPDREDIAAVYRFVRSSPWACADNEMLYCRLRSIVSYGKMKLSLEILEELKLIEITHSGNRQSVKVIPTKAKVDLGSSALFQKLHAQS